MSLNVGTLAAKLGLDTQDFIEKMRGVSGATKFFSDEYSRSMRQTSREGAEAFRTLDEMIGIHLNRPMTRLLVETFPSFAKGLQSILGGVAFGAVAYAVTEVYDRISKGIEKAQKAQEEWQASIRKTESTIESVADSYARKIAEANGLDPLTKRAMAGADEARAAFEKVSAAIEEQNKKAQEAAGIWAGLMLAVGQTAHEMFTSAAGLNTENLRGQLGTLKVEIEEAFRLDALNGTHKAMAVFQRDLEMATQKVRELQAEQAKQGAAQSLSMLLSARKDVSPEQIAAAQQWVDLLKQAITIENDRQKLDNSKANGAEAQAKATEAIVAMYRSMEGGLNKLQPETEPLKKLANEIGSLKVAAEKDFFAIAGTIASALDLHTAQEHLSDYEHRLDELMLKARRDADVTAAAAKLPTTIAPTGQAPNVGARTAMPTLGAGGVAGAKLDTFANDQAAQLKLAAQSYEQAMTAQDKYRLGQQELELLISKGLIDNQAFAAGMAQLDQQLVKAADSAHKLQEEMQKLLERSNDAGAGLKAYAIQLQINAAENGKFAYDVLTASTKGAETDAAKSLMMILEEQRGGHRALIHDLEKMWSDYFKNLAMMGMKNSMDQLLGPLGKAINGGSASPDNKQGSASPDSKQAGAKAPTGFLSWLMPKQAGPGATGAASLTGAGTLLTHAGTELLSAAMALRVSAGAGGAAGAPAGGGSPFGDIAALGGAIPFFESGGDATPGSSFVSGEAGAERVDLGRSGGAHITPLGAPAGGGDTYHNYDMRGAVVTEDLMRRSEAAHAIRASEGRMMSAMPAMQREISLRKRS